MNTACHFPSFCSSLPDLNQFIHKLDEEYHAGKLNTWEDLEEFVDAFFTSERMDAMEVIVPGWRKMASYSHGVTLTHVTCAFLGMVGLPEFQDLSLEQQELLKWMVLFHDVEKEVREGKRDPRHGFRSAVTAARQLPHLDFPATAEYDHVVASWSEFTYAAVKPSESYIEPIQDNEKLPEILTGIERMFGAGTPAALIVKGVLLHMSITVLRDWKQAAPLTETEIGRYLTSDLMPLLKVLMLADNDGWVLFYPQREQQRRETLETFQRIEKIISP